MKWVKENEEVFYPKRTEIIEVAKQDIDYLIQAGQNNTRNRARYCTHSSAEDDVHEMIIYIKKDTYIRPHKHIGKTESFLLIDGEVCPIVLQPRVPVPGFRSVSESPVGRYWIDFDQIL